MKNNQLHKRKNKYKLAKYVYTEGLIAFASRTSQNFETVKGLSYQDFENIIKNNLTK